MAILRGQRLGRTKLSTTVGASLRARRSCRQMVARWLRCHKSSGARSQGRPFHDLLTSPRGISRSLTFTACLAGDFPPPENEADRLHMGISWSVDGEQQLRCVAEWQDVHHSASAEFGDAERGGLEERACGDLGGVVILSVSVKETRSGRTFSSFQALQQTKVNTPCYRSVLRRGCKFRPATRTRYGACSITSDTTCRLRTWGVAAARAWRRCRKPQAGRSNPGWGYRDPADGIPGRVFPCKFWLPHL